MNEKDIREYSRTLLDAFNDLTGNSINPNLDDFLKIRERSIFELNSFHKNNQKTNEKNEIVDDNKIVNVPSNQKTNVDENKSVNEVDDLKEKKELSSTSTLKVEKQKNTKTENKPTLIQNKNQNIDNKESKNVVKNETSNSNVIADETDDFVFGNDEDNFNMSERKTAFDILKEIEDPWN
jgi:hypothetical protein